jgi:hypothetical protein
MYKTEKQGLSLEELEMEQVELLPDRELLGRRKKSGDFAFNFQNAESLAILGNANSQNNNVQFV